MTAPEAFDEFWTIFRRNEKYLKIYGQHQCLDWELRSHADLVAICDQVQQYLKSVTRHRLFDGPGEIDRFSAHNYHEALVLVLNPPEQWFRQLWVLNSPEYLALKAGAKTDEQTVLEKGVETLRQKPLTNRPRKKKPPKETAEKDLFNRRSRVLLDLLLNVHGCNSGDPLHKPLTQSELENRLRDEKTPIAQSTISRAMEDLMALVPLPGKLSGMEKYGVLCDEGQICDALSGLQVRSNKYLYRGLHDKYERSDENIEHYHDKGY